MSDLPSDKELRRAQDEFHALLMKPRTTETEFQAFFAAHPYVLSRSLPLRIEPSQIVATKPGTSEPDFIVYPKPNAPLQTAAVVELKRPDQQIATVTRKTIVQFTRDVETGIMQCKQASKNLAKVLQSSIGIAIGNDVHQFLIVGLRAGLESLGADGLAMLSERAGRCRFIPYDDMYREFSASVPRPVMILTPDFAPPPPMRLYLSTMRASTDLGVQRFDNRVYEAVMSFALGAPGRIDPVSRPGPIAITIPRDVIWDAGGMIQVADGHFTDIQLDERETAELAGVPYVTVLNSSNPSVVYVPPGGMWVWQVVASTLHDDEAMGGIVRDVLLDVLLPRWRDRQM